MNLPKKILVPVDFSDRSTEALDYAVDLATTLGAEIVLLHVYEIPAVTYPDGVLVMTGDIASRIVGAAEAALASLAKGHARGVKMETRLQMGNAWRVITGAVEETGSNLIVMATSGRSGLPRALFGSVAEKVVRMATCPVLTLHEHGRGPTEP